MFRSQVAEVLFNHVKNNAIEVKSCGTWVEKEGLTGKKLKDFDGINESMSLTNLIEVMKEKGFDISENICKPITPELINWADKIISMAEVEEQTMWTSHVQLAPALQPFHAKTPALLAEL